MATMTQSDALAQKVYAVRAKRHPGLQTWDKLPEHARDHWRDVTATVWTVVIEEIAPALLASVKHLSAVSDSIYVRMSDGEFALMRKAWDAVDAAVAAADAALTNGGA